MTVVADPVMAQTLPRGAAVKATGASVARGGAADLLGKLLRSGQAAGITPVATKTALNYPYGIAVDASSNIYVTNIFGGVNVYSKSYKLTGTITTGINVPAAVGISFNGDIYVANDSGNNITIYNPSLTLVGTITDSSLDNPFSLYIDPDDTIWVLDAAGTLHSYLSDNTVLPTTKTGGTTVGPWGPYVTVWGVPATNGGYEDLFQNRGQILHDGTFPWSYFPQGSPYAGGEAEDADDQQYVSDYQHNLVQIWDRSSEYQIGTIATPAAPIGVAVDPVLNRLYVAQPTLNEVYVYSTKPPYKQMGIIK